MVYLDQTAHDKMHKDYTNFVNSAWTGRYFFYKDRGSSPPPARLRVLSFTIAYQ